MAQASDHAPVVDVPTAHRVETSRNDQDERPHSGVAEGSVERRAGDVRLVQRHAQAIDTARSGSKVATTDRRPDSIEHDAREKLRGRIASVERRLLVKVTV